MSLLTRLADLRLQRARVGDLSMRLLHPSEHGVHLDDQGNLRWEPALSAAVVDALRRADEGAFIDVGAAFGYFSHLANQILPASRIHAFEPSTPRRLVFRANNLLNRAAIHIDPRYVADRTAGDRITLDAYCRARDLRPAVVKMDIEGGEYYAVQGMSEVCRQHRPVLLIELHERILREQMRLEPSDVLETLRRYGYAIGYLDHHHATGQLRVLTDKPNDVNYEVVATGS